MEAHMAPKNRREPIFELAKKFQFLQEHAVSRRQCGHDDNESSFCNKLGIPRNTIRGSLQKDRLSAAHQRVLADKCDFSLNWPEWNDSTADRSAKGDARGDTCEAFKARYLKHHSRKKRASSLRPGDLNSNCDEAVAEGCKTGGLQLRLIVVEDATPIVESLGSIEVCATDQFIEGEDGTLSGTVICRPANLGDVRIAVRFCKVRLLRKPEYNATQTGERPKPIEPVQNDKKVGVTIQRVGTSQRTTVELKVASGEIGMVNLPDDIWPVLEAKEGDQFEAQLIVYLRDCALVSDGDDAKPIGSQELPDDGNSFIRPGWDRLGKALPLIQKRFEELKLSDGETDWALLHRYVVQLAPVHAAGGSNDGS